MRPSTILLAAALALSPLTASAAIPLSASLGVSTLVLWDRGFDLVSPADHLAMPRVAAGYTVRRERSSVSGELAFVSGGAAQQIHEARDAQLWLRGVEASAIYRRSVARLFEPYARLSAGWDWATLTISPGAGRELLQRVSGPSISAGLGFTVPLLIIEREGRPSTRVQLDADLGWALRAAAVFDALAPPEPDRPDPEAIPRAPVVVGTLPLSGLTWRLGVTVQL